MGPQNVHSTPRSDIIMKEKKEEKEKEKIPKSVIKNEQITEDEETSLFKMLIPKKKQHLIPKTMANSNVNRSVTKNVAKKIKSNQPPIAAAVTTKRKKKKKNKESSKKKGKKKKDKHSKQKKKKKKNGF